MTRRPAVGVLALTALLGIAATAQAEPPPAPRRIVTLAPHLAELVCTVGACDRLVGVSAFSERPPAVAALPRVGDGFAVHLEAVLALRPDLVLAWQDVTPATALRQLYALGLHVVSLPGSRLDDIPLALSQLDPLLGTTAGAAAAQDFHNRLQALRRRYAGRPPLSVFFQLGAAPVYTVGPGSSIDDALSSCGARNLFADLGTASAAVSLEAVVARRPQLVVYSRSEAAAIDRQWQALAGAGPPLRHAFDSDPLARPSAAMLDGVETLCALIDQARSVSTSKPSPSAMRYQANGTKLWPDT